MARDLEILVLTPDGYQPQPHSTILPNLDPGVVARFARLENEQATSQILRAFQACLTEKC